MNGNVSTGSGGGLSLLDNANVLIEDTRIEGNSTTASYGPGGGIYGEFARMELVRCTIANNSAPGSSSDGGGIYSTFDTTMIHSCTIAENGTNEPNGTGGGIYYLAGEHSLENTIIAFNSPGKGMSCVMATPDVRCSDLYGNQDGDGICGNDKGGNFSLDPLFCDLKENDYSLHCSSPCHENNHPTSEPCGRVGAHGLGGCNIVAVEEADGEELARPGSEMYATPNPFSPSTTIHFSLQRPARVSLSVYSLSGRRVRLLEEGSLGTGEYQVVWDGRSDAGRHLPSGVYFYRLEGTSPSRTGRLLLAR